MSFSSLDWQSILLSYVRRTFPTKGYTQGRIADTDPLSITEARFYAKGLKALSEHFNGIESLAATNYFNLKPYRAAYLLYFFPANWAKMSMILGQRPPLPSDTPPFRILDLGSGPGPLSLSAAHTLSTPPLLNKAGRNGVLGWPAEPLSHPAATVSGADGGSQRFHRTGPENVIPTPPQPIPITIDMVDQSESALTDAKTLSQLIFPSKNVTVNTHSTRITPQFLSRHLRNRYSLIVVGDFLNELNRAARLHLLTYLLESALIPGGQLILVEPALQRTARDLQLLRDLTLKTLPHVQVVAPCLRQGSCPLNHYNRRDWCHFYSEWKRPQWLDLLEKTAGLRKEWLKYAYLVFQNQAPLAPTQDQTLNSSQWRVISNPMKIKGNLELALCGPQGRIHLTGQFKHKSSKNGDFFNLRRGDIARLYPREWPELQARAEGWDYRLTLLPEHHVVDASDSIVCNK